ncbi:MAG TPA: EAL domain-containing protein [Pyrinomonadaceae bacterium]|jgi:diguanylate cyclase (GGDEF)-like protein/PAS domain S-box-containing protein|nr:EAL domain-containing protein [Pyrinomonadaceae bacterium]
MDTQPIRVLLVDDDEDDYVMTRDMLAELGRGAFLLDWVASYEEARGAVSRGEHDVYLLDYRLGERSGLDLLREAGGEGRGAPMILLTGQGGDEVDAEAMKAGAADYLVKGSLEASLLGRSIRYAVERARASRALRESEERYHRLVELSPDAILVHAGGEIVFVNGAGVRLLGAEAGGQIVGRPIKEFVRHDRQEGVGKRIYGAEGDATFMEEKLVRSDGTELCVEAAAVPFVYKDGPAVQVVARDISRRKQMEERLLHDAFHDALTGLPNRALFMDHLKLAVERAKRPKKKHLFAVLFLDLDRFKVINDSLGHTMGDQLLVATAARIQKCLRHLDTVARFGGDEFAVLLDGVEDVNDTIRVAQRLQREITTPMNVGGHEVFTSVSIGIALSDTGYERPEDVVRDADTAMYRAKAAGKSRYEIFDTGMHSRAVALLRLENDLRRAVEREEFIVHYQPIVSLFNDSIQGFEALVRWRHPERGLVTPSEFIPVAEETGLIIPLGRWVLREACRQMHQLQAASAGPRPLSLSVNLSGKQFMQPDLVGQVEEILRETAFDPRRLQLEITESSVIENTETVTQMLLQLRALGIRLSMDDFGTGYSSLSYLHRFPIHTLKIDRSFVSGGDGENEIVRTIIMLARNMGMDIVAEGVETPEQLAYLKELKCEYGQGFLFSHPLDLDTACKLLESANAGLTDVLQELR